VRVQLTQDEWNRAIAMGSKWHSESKDTAYGRGHTRTLRPSEVGAIGEAAFAKLTGVAADLGYKRGGDAGYDFKFGGIEYNVKVSEVEGDGALRVIAVDNERGYTYRINPMTTYVRGHLVADELAVVFSGYAEGWRIKRNFPDLVPGVGGGWSNYVVPREKLVPLERILKKPPQAE